jgi:hypothetical protein
MILAITFFIASLDSVPCFVWAFIWQFVTWPYTYTYPCYHMTICIHLPMLSHDDIPTPTHVITWPYTYTYPCYHMTIYLHLPMLSHDHIPTPTHVSIINTHKEKNCISYDDNHSYITTLNGHCISMHFRSYMLFLYY